MITQKSRKRLTRFVTNAQKHLEWLRVRKWELEQKKNTPVEILDISSRIQEVIQDIDLVCERIFG